MTHPTAYTYVGTHICWYTCFCTCKIPTHSSIKVFSIWTQLWIPGLVYCNIPRQRGHTGILLLLAGLPFWGGARGSSLPPAGFTFGRGGDMRNPIASCRVPFLRRGKRILLAARWVHFFLGGVTCWGILMLRAGFSFWGKAKGVLQLRAGLTFSKGDNRSLIAASRVYFFWGRHARFAFWTRKVGTLLRSGWVPFLSRGKRSLIAAAWQKNVLKNLRIERGKHTPEAK